MNPIFRIALQQAKKLITNPQKAEKLMHKAKRKSNKLSGEDKNLIDTLKENIQLFLSMIGDFFTGKYRKIPLKSGIKILAALLYFVLLVDLVPDFLAVIGLADDAAVIAWVISSISDDIEKYKTWKATQTTEITKQLNV